MRNPTPVTISITTAALVFALAGCGTNDTEQQDADTSADDERVTELEANVEALQADLDALAGDVADMDSQPEPEDATEPTGDATADTADEETESETEPATDDADTGGEAVLGEPVAISGWADGLDIEQAGTITLNDVEVGYTNDACYDAPINDHYLALNLTVEADADAYEEIAATQFDFYLVDGEGTIYRDEAQTFEAFSCASTAGSLEWVPAGTNHTGYILLDTDLTEGTIVYEGVGEDVVWSF